MTLSEAQAKVNSQIMSYGGYWRPLSMMHRMIEEIGELARAINIKYGDKKSKSASDGREVGIELADVLYTSIAIANLNNINLEDELPLYKDVSSYIDNKLLEQDMLTTNPLSVILKLVKKIGGLSELLDVKFNDECNINADLDNKIYDAIINIVKTVINISIELNIKDFINEFNQKVKADENKMTKIYKKDEN